MPKHLDPFRIVVSDGLDTLLIAHGPLPDQKSCEHSFDLVRREFEINVMGVLSMLAHAANGFERQDLGTLYVISPVAGDRGRQSNYVYGAAKGAGSIFLQGMRNRLNSRGVQVLTVNPGFVDTPRMATFAKSRLWTSPVQVARGIYKAIIKKGERV